MSNKILITGATGTIGKALVNQLQQRGEDFIVGSRDFTKAHEVLKIPKEQWVLFDFNNPDTFQNAVEKVAKVFFLAPPLTLNLDKILKLFMGFLKEKAIKRLVYISALGNETLKGDLAFHGIMENYLKENQFDYTILQPSFFSQNFKNYEYENLMERNITFVPAGEGKVGFIDVEDIASVASRVLTEEGHSGKTYRLTGPELLSYYEAAAILSEVLGKTIHYANPSEEDYRGVLAAAGAPPIVADYMIPIYGMIKNGSVGFLTNDIEKVIGKSPTPLEIVLKRDFR